jgi:hypothetical protein
MTIRRVSHYDRAEYYKKLLDSVHYSSPYRWDELVKDANILIRDFQLLETHISPAVPLGIHTRVASDIIERERGVPAGVMQEEITDFRKAKDKAARVSVAIKRFGMALVIGVALIGPMLIMVLRPGKVTALVTTSVPIFLFTIFIATWLLLFSSAWEDND